MIHEYDGAGDWRHVPMFRKAGSRWEHEPDTEADAATWDAWVRRRDQLRRELDQGGSDQ